MTTKEHRTKHDREIAAIRKLILTGMQMLNRNAEQISRLTKDVRALAAAQKRTEAALASFISRTNGHTRRKVDLQ